MKTAPVGYLIDPVRLNRAIMRAQLDIRAMSGRTQIDFDRLRQIFGGSTRPTMIELESIADAVGMTVADITINTGRPH